MWPKWSVNSAQTCEQGPLFGPLEFEEAKMSQIVCNLRDHKVFFKEILTYNTTKNGKDVSFFVIYKYIESFWKMIGHISLVNPISLVPSLPCSFVQTLSPIRNIKC